MTPAARMPTARVAPERRSVRLEERAGDEGVERSSCDMRPFSARESALRWASPEIYGRRVSIVFQRSLCVIS
jgi:hypothetical protein